MTIGQAFSLLRKAGVPERNLWGCVGSVEAMTVEEFQQTVQKCTDSDTDLVTVLARPRHSMRLLEPEFNTFDLEGYEF